jgi:hypothetical protein
VSGRRIHPWRVLADYACIPGNGNLLDNHKKTIGILAGFKFAHCLCSFGWCGDDNQPVNILDDSGLYYRVGMLGFDSL